MSTSRARVQSEDVQDGALHQGAVRGCDQGLHEGHRGRQLRAGHAVRRRRERGHGEGASGHPG
eukprot:1483259-Pyramimonas_sp.AAC.1